MQFADRLVFEIKRKKTPLIVGLDPRFQQLPEEIRREVKSPMHSPDWYVQVAKCYERFCKGVLDAVSPLVPAIKPQMAFFEQLGPAGMLAVANIINYATDLGLLVILDGKRNDIGSTAEAYASAYLGRSPRSAWGADALTVNPWMGCDSLAPFVARCRETDSGIFVLVKTSNPGSEDFQSLDIEGEPVYRRVAREVERLAFNSRGENDFGCVGAVVGATYPKQLEELRSAMPHTLFLIPGFGAQGGSAKDVSFGFRSDGTGAVVNSSRAILFAHESPIWRESNGSDWQRCVECAAKEAIQQLAADTPAGKL